MFGEILSIVNFRGRQFQIAPDRVAEITPGNSKLGLFAGLLSNTFCLFRGNYSFLGDNVQDFNDIHLILQLCNALI
jgi:hypothetical protein